MRVNDPVAGNMEKKLPIKLTKLMDSNSLFGSSTQPSFLLKAYAPIGFNVLLENANMHLLLQWKFVLRMRGPLPRGQQKVPKLIMRVYYLSFGPNVV